MTSPTADPARTFAMLVGVERYAGGWDLDGPVHDVLEFREWLLTQRVPANQIMTLVSPSARNTARVDAAGIGGAPATAEGIRGALNVLHDRQGDLLIIFWTGHGFIHGERHRLLVADATDNDKRNFDLDGLRSSLASSYFAGFPRQVLVVDACANFERFGYTPASEELPRGEPLPREQFVFFAAQAGQVAKNLGDERRGLFSRELLAELRRLPDASWPPDMRLVAGRVQNEFAIMRAAGDLDQTPVYEWSRDWDGNVVELKTASERPRGKGEKEPWELTFEQLAALTEALMACKAMSGPADRDDVLRQVRTNIRVSVERRNSTKSDIVNILETAANYPGGLEELLRAVRWFEDADSYGWRKVERVVGELLPNLLVPTAEASRRP